MKLYTKTICPKCLWVKSEFAARGIELEEVNIDQQEEARAFLQQQGILAVPVLQTEQALYVTTPDILQYVQNA